MPFVMLVIVTMLVLLLLLLLLLLIIIIIMITIILIVCLSSPLGLRGSPASTAEPRGSQPCHRAKKRELEETKGVTRNGGRK